jgi:hypothetical protein
MLAQNVATSGFVPAEVAHGKIRHAHLHPSTRGRRCRTRIRGGGRLTRDQATHRQRDSQTNYAATSWEKSCHPAPNYDPSTSHSRAVSILQQF